MLTNQNSLFSDLQRMFKASAGFLDENSPKYVKLFPFCLTSKYKCETLCSLIAIFLY